MTTESCKHEGLPGTSFLEKCPSCGSFFVIRSVVIEAASNTPGPFPFVALYAYPSNFLGWIEGDSFKLRRL